MPYTLLGDLQSLTLASNVTCDNLCCILTLNNEVILMGNMLLTDYVADATIATLPETMRPIDDIVLPIIVDTQQSYLTINSNGELKLPLQITAGMLYCNGLSFNVCDRYYNSTIGNNFSQGTSPLIEGGEEPNGTSV